MDKPNVLTCTHCNIIKPISDFATDRRKKLGVIKTCRKCSYKKRKEAVSYISYKDRMRRDYAEDREFRQKRIIERRLYKASNLEAVMLSNAKLRARRNNLDFNITLNDIVIPKFCPLLEIPLFPGNNTSKANAPTLDRINPTKGYIKGNVRVISYKANTMKNDATLELLEVFIKNLPTYLNNDIV